jgi:hypothetical protein
VLIDQFNEDFNTIPNCAFLVVKIEITLSPEQMKTELMKSIYDKLSPTEYKYVFDVPQQSSEKHGIIQIHGKEKNGLGAMPNLLNE